MSMHLLQLSNYPIFDQLLIEEKLLRSDKRNWCIINQGSTPAIVMGISGKKEELVDCTRAATDNIPLIRRFSGGGTVIVDHNTLFITFICHKELHPFPAYPEPIMRWTEEIYSEVFKDERFKLRENDNVLGHKKCGGNAQYIKKDKWLHHTSFLWDFSPENMSYLLMPKKTPAYREARPHTDFLCRLNEHFATQQEMLTHLSTALAKRFTIHNISLDEVLTTLTEPERQATSTA
jgi:lipoate-protein ligase A